MIRRTYYSPPEVVRVGRRWRLIWRYKPDFRYDVVTKHWTRWSAWHATRKGPPPEPSR